MGLLTKLKESKKGNEIIVVIWTDVVEVYRGVLLRDNLSQFLTDK